MQQEIKQRLQHIEKMHNIRILYACEAGSRAYGLHTEQSDYDVRFIFKYDVTQYLKLKAPREVINDQSLRGADIQGWDLYKAMHLFTKSNPSLYEWLHSPVVYQEDQAFSSQLRRYIESQYALKKLGFHYWQLMKSNLKKKLSSPISIGDIKVCLHVMRAYLSVQSMRTHHALPPLSFEELVMKGTLPKDISEYTISLQQAKRHDEVVEKEVCLSIMNFAEQQLPFFKEQLEELGEGALDEELLNQWIISLQGN
ncbi:nucleotidyltransferase domain-containing protein [Priestia abyssalis]|uniref:nucleotidyltransferase domain-containing protein n=1 Tax=Priestia abyssalis TaxID=1221450 RepID=UPI000995CFFD|nr:nucleotidyltransferase domain-containing protein [Priestia abyssalis]